MSRENIGQKRREEIQIRRKWKSDREAELPGCESANQHDDRSGKSMREPTKSASQCESQQRRGEMKKAPKIREEKRASLAITPGKREKNGASRQAQRRKNGKAGDFETPR